ncbi:hypothetical protein SSBR45G_64770 [Bradyrhizobium sp. SSBR45G]|uniref:hypothetical protein n=1 Tax=unclassified Bradyrhizobium TaxID=2631580 RepID=UPI0023428D4E|nr:MULTISPECIES: hypothetical protein [unclassified Bradyrhizobium]GLH81568.1 hypothetical protein SSBR45G_64770 [Bradyrhizobium sp. SSBR45G]GLH89026.1 hypothetical protein SSBR45R_64870 [Bradyrhizobium sp. SSBR45R]
MAGRTAGVAFAIAAGIAGLLLIALPRTAMTAEECLTEPSGDKSDAQHWYYRFDRGTNRRCWYLKDANGREMAVPARATQQPAAWDFAQPTPPKLTPRRTDGPAQRSNADAMAELPQTRLRTGVDARGTPKPQNLAITPTTLTASDASLPRSLDASPWTSAPPQQVDTTTTDTSPAAMAGDGNADTDANAAAGSDSQAAVASKATKPEAPIHVLMLVVIGALAISGLLASALYRLSRMGRRRKRNGSWHEDARSRRGRMKARTKAPQPAGSRAGRGGMPGPSYADSGRGAQPVSALELAGARLGSSQPEHMESRAYRQAQAPAPQHQDHQPVSARRRELDAASDMQRPQNTDAVWQAIDQLADRASAQRAPAANSQQMAAAVAQPPAAAMMPPAAPPAPQQQLTPQLAAAQMAAAQAAAASIAAAKANAAATSLAAQAPPRAAPVEAPPQSWSPPPQAAAPAAPAATSTAAPPAPVDVGEIVSALRKARTGDAASSGGGAPLDAAKVIAALLVSRAAKRRVPQAAAGETGETPVAAVPAATAPPVAEAAASQTATAAQQLMERLRNGQPAAQPEHARSADPAAALIETLRAHAARQPAYQDDEDDDIAAAEPAARVESTAADDELDDPAAALINLLQSRFSLPEDEPEPAQDEEEEFAAAEAPQNLARLQDDPAAQLMSMLESRSSIPPAPPVIDRPQAPPPQQHHVQPQQHLQPRQQPPQQQHLQPQLRQQQAPQRPPQQQQRAPQQQRPPFVPTSFEDPASPPLDFIPRPPALRPRPRNIQQDESLDGIQDILARLGRRA